MHRWWGRHVAAPALAAVGGINAILAGERIRDHNGSYTELAAWSGGSIPAEQYSRLG
jgi:hypothetical protein